MCEGVCLYTSLALLAPLFLFFFIAFSLYSVFFFPFALFSFLLVLLKERFKSGIFFFLSHDIGSLSKVNVFFFSIFQGFNLDPSTISFVGILSYNLSPI